MRRALAVLAVAAPVIAVALVSALDGQLVEINNFNADVTSSYVSAAQCAGAPLKVEWNIGGTPAFAAEENIQVYATNAEPAVPTGGTFRVCATEEVTGGTGNVFTKLVGTTPATRDSQQLDLSANDVVVGGAHFTCDAASETKVVHVCAHWTLAGEAPKGSAIGKFIVQVKPPNAPPSVSAAPGDGALNVSWPAATTEGDVVAARSYRVVALQDGTEVGRVDDTTARSVRISGLENEVAYEVRVFGLSVAKNPSLTFATTTGTPKPVNDFWEQYESVGGKEEGGCGSGGAGPLALLAVSGLLAVLRRRK